MKINIDGKEILVKDPIKNIVEIGDENGITITAPCFRNNKKHGCCGACVIEIEGKKSYACTTKPKDGMAITYKRDDLEAIRKEKLTEYAEGIKSGNTMACSGSTESKSDCGCNCSC